MRQPNIIYVFTDQQSAAMMSCTGNPWLRTPAMDSLAARGVRFDRAYCTNPVCLPSRFSMITGRMPSFAGIRSNEWQQETSGLRDSLFENGLGNLFKSAGYDVVYGGKVHLPGFNPDRLGFDILTDDERDGLAADCAKYIRCRSGDKPYFLYISLINPHDICFMAIKDGHDPMLEMADEMARRFNLSQQQIDQFMAGPRLLESLLAAAADADPASMPPLPANHQPQADEPEAIGLMLDQRPFRRHAREYYDEHRWRLHRWAYCRLTELVDRQLQVILEAVDASGEADNTVIIFTSDHGDHDSAHKLEHKDAPYEEACRVPLIIADPRVKDTSGQIDTRHLVSNGLDLIPTLCDYAGIRHPYETLEGVSLKGLAEGLEPSGWRDCLPVESEFGRAIVTASHKYVRYFEGASCEQLYDLISDPGETRNALRDSEQQAALADLREIFNRYYTDARVQTV